jgi:hypothetical protein
LAVDVRSGFAKPQQQSLNWRGVQTDTNVTQERNKRKRAEQEGSMIENVVEQLRRRSIDECESLADGMLKEFAYQPDGSYEDFMLPSHCILIDCRFRGTRSEMLKYLVRCYRTQAQRPTQLPLHALALDEQFADESTLVGKS